MEEGPGGEEVCVGTSEWSPRLREESLGRLPPHGSRQEVHHITPPQEVKTDAVSAKSAWFLESYTCIQKDDSGLPGNPGRISLDHQCGILVDSEAQGVRVRTQNSNQKTSPSSAGQEVPFLPEGDAGIRGRP